MPEQPTKYVVYWCESLRDGIEEGARVKSTIEGALQLITSLSNGWLGNTTFRLFELGKEIPLTQETIEIPQPAIKRIAYRTA